MTANSTNRAGWIAIALGSNLGDRKGYLHLAHERLRGGGLAIELVSTVREYEAVRDVASNRSAEHPRFLNQVVAAPRASWSGTPGQLLDLCRRIEADAGRATAAGPRWSDRRLDLDILLFGYRVHHDSRLQIPHPRLTGRRFVLEPLAEILPDAIHPVCGATMTNLLAGLDLRDSHAFEA